MNIEDLKQNIEQRTGVPAALLTGETAEENIAQAKALLAYRRQSEAARQKTTAEQFADWFNAYEGTQQQDEAGKALEDIEAAVRAETSIYPQTQDNGEVDPAKLPDGRSAAEQFAEWFRGKTAIDPQKDENGWKRYF